MCRRVRESTLLISGQDLENWTKESPENRQIGPSLSSLLEDHPHLPSWVLRGTPQDQLCSPTEDVNEVRLTERKVVKQSPLSLCLGLQETDTRIPRCPQKGPVERGTGKQEQLNLLPHNTQICSYLGTTNLPSSLSSSSA